MLMVTSINITMLTSGGAKVTVFVLEALCCFHIGIEIRLYHDVDVPFLLGLEWELSHWDIGKGAC